MSTETLVTKPASGHWSDAYPELGRGPVSLEDCVSEDFYDKEREHGDGTTLLLEEGLYVKVAVRKVYGERSYYGGERPVTDVKIGFFLCDEEGTTLRAIYDPVYSLVELGDAIANSEAR